MGSAAVLEHRGCDLDSREEIEQFVTRFYRDVAQDDLLGPYFNHIARVDWYAHTGKLTDYWCGILLHTPAEPLDVMGAHRWLHEQAPLGPEHFERWLEAFTTTVDAGWTGPLAEYAKKRGHGMIWAMSRRFLGATPRELELR